ncbi:MAG: histidine--tRNA ligase [Muribaculaceae bacterium]|nr:histidine--tRNA ligase [Muribaculaceae bacterium]
MASQLPTIPKGTRDFSPIEMARRNYIFDTIKKAFILYGYQQIETPAMENLSTLMGKYGEEGDKLLFKILNSGDFMKEVNTDDVSQRNLVKLTNAMCEKGLRYDLTVPFARYVVQHRNDLQFPFKRYQVQPVWRADRPQKGRYREFYQCDADVVGSDSLINEVELLSLADYVFGKFGIRVLIKLNNRKVLSGIAELIGAPEKIVDITVAIDKIDKIGIENVNEELRSKGLAETSINILQPLLLLSGSNEEKLAKLTDLLRESETGMKGIEELKYVLNHVAKLGIQSDVEVDVSLARGLNYYTGSIVEVKAKDVEIGSISGGGRYDNLTGVFGLQGVSGVGISFGADRIYDVLNALNLYPETVNSSSKILFVNFGETEAEVSLEYVMQLRKEGVSAEVYPEPSKMKKQMGYADAKGIPYVAIIGETEVAEGVITLKEMSTGEQYKLTLQELVEKVKK